jgi:hypothetical protein
MGRLRYLTALMMNLVPMAALADSTEWRKYVIPDTSPPDLPLAACIHRENAHRDINFSASRLACHFSC